ncbi:MAG: SAM-dependent methyltransferase [Rhodospirillaceae bacterium]|nr:SAM-dependent methyltransferase [Rhodospirillaceae bacterium]
MQAGLQDPANPDEMALMAQDTPLPPRQQLLRITGHVMLARCLGIAAELGIADLIDPTPLSAPDLAIRTSSHGPSLYRLLRYLAANGIFSEDADGRFRNTETSQLLRSGVAGSMRDSVRQSWQDVTWDTFRNLPHTIKTGEPAFTKAFGADFFDYLAAHPDVGARFDAAMAMQSAPENDSVAAAYPFGDAKTVVDIGGGRGGFMATLLKANSNVCGMLFDQAHVLAQPNHVRDAGLASRCEMVVGNFFERIPSGGDVYVLKRILHDWDDDTAVRILKNCAAAMNSSAKLIAVDAVIKPGNDPDANKALDVGIMALLSGRERTADEFDKIYRAAGLRLTRIIATAAPSTMSLVEGVVAQA